jgi:hypothetical protein
MTSGPQRSITPSSGGGFFKELTTRVKLVLRLLGDRRVNIFLKALPVFSVLYFLFPDIAPGPIDDAFIIWLGSYLFIELCPENVVEEHMQRLKQVVPGDWKDLASRDQAIDGEFNEEAPADQPEEEGKS